MTKDEWNARQTRLVKAWAQGDIVSAFAEIAHVVAHGSDAMKAQALIYRGMIQEDSDLAAARQDWIEALSHAPQGSHTRHVAQEKIAQACERLNLKDDAISWYRSALETCADGHEFPGGHVLKSFLALIDGPLSPSDQALTLTVAKKSWRLLGLAGEPDWTDLRRVADLVAPRSEPRDDQ